MDIMDLRRVLLMSMAQGGLPVGLKAFAKGTETTSTATEDIKVTTDTDGNPIEYEWFAMKFDD